MHLKYLILRRKKKIKGELNKFLIGIGSSLRRLDWYLDLALEVMIIFIGIFFIH